MDTLNAEKAALTQHPTGDKVLMLTQEKKMALCETCGSFLVANDAAERTQSHVTGKQHIGYGMVRDFISEFKVNFLDGICDSGYKFDFLVKWLSYMCLFCRLQESRRDLLGRRKQKSGESKGRRNILIGIGIGIVNVFDTATVDVNGKGLVNVAVEGAGKEGGGLIGDIINTETGGTGIGTGSVTEMQMPCVTGLE